ncbi:MAG: hypothetical protein AAB790_03680 [Patescibacteria group bacterium]
MTNILREKVVTLRLRGKTYGEIQKFLKIRLPKSTISYWCKDVSLSGRQKAKIESISKIQLARGRILALENKNRRAREREIEFKKRNKTLYHLYKTNSDSRKLALTFLYLAEGSKSARGSLMFGNSDPEIIRVFMRLLRSAFKLDEKKFRVTVQCRADQDSESLKSFWSDVTGVPSAQFYKTQVDKRTLGKPTRKQHYKGVCRIDYFSSDVDLELKHIAKELERM